MMLMLLTLTFFRMLKLVLSAEHANTPCYTIYINLYISIQSIHSVLLFRSVQLFPVAKRHQRGAGLGASGCASALWHVTLDRHELGWSLTTSNDETGFATNNSQHTYTQLRLNLLNLTKIGPIIIIGCDYIVCRGAGTCTTENHGKSGYVALHPQRFIKTHSVP